MSEDYQEGSLVSRQRGKKEGRTGIDNAPLPTYSEWVGQQKDLVKKLKLSPETAKFIAESTRKVCDICYKPIPKGSRLKLCSFHKASYFRERTAERVRKHRKRSVTGCNA